ncbi:MAG TPA: hemerythrin domain-containing protein [Anaeromyxobacter sp.]
MSVGTRMYREQHDHLRALSQELERHLHDDLRDGAAARLAVSRLAGALQVHLAMEDESLYPSLVVHPNAELRERARRLRDDLSGLRSALGGYLRRWPTHLAIEREPPAFAAETRALLERLAKRIALEDEELFALADALP